MSAHDERQSISDLSRRGLYRRLVAQSSIYTLGSLLQQATSLVLLPLYLSYLTPEDFGILALTDVVVSVLAALLGLGIATAVTRFYWQWRQEGVEAGAVGTLWVVGCAVALAVVLALQVWGGAVLPLIIAQVPFDPYMRLALWQALLTTVTQVPLALLRIREEAGAFVRWSYFVSASTLVLNIYFVAIAQQGALGILRGSLTGMLLSALVGVWVMVRRVSFEQRLPQVREALRFTLPMVPAGLLDSAAGGVDRLFLEKFLPLSQVGIYSVAMRIVNAGVRTIALTSFKTAWIPFAIRLNTERDDGRLQTARITNLILAGASCLAVLTAMFSQEVLLLLGRGAYLPATVYVPFLVVANLIFVLDPVAIVGFLMSKRTEYALPLTMVQLATSAFLNYVLISHIGALGAALAAVGTFATVVACRFWISQRFYYIPYDWSRLLSVFGLVVLTLVFNAGVVEVHPSVVTGFLLKLVLLAGYLAILGWLVLARSDVVNVTKVVGARLRATWHKWSPVSLGPSEKL